MAHQRSAEAARVARTDRNRMALSPYVIDDVTFTLEEIRRARSGDTAVH